MVDAAGDARNCLQKVFSIKYSGLLPSGHETYDGDGWHTGRSCAEGDLAYALPHRPPFRSGRVHGNESICQNGSRRGPEVRFDEGRLSQGNRGVVVPGREDKGPFGSRVAGPTVSLRMPESTGMTEWVSRSR